MESLAKPWMWHLQSSRGEYLSLQGCQHILISFFMMKLTERSIRLCGMNKHKANLESLHTKDWCRFWTLFIVLYLDFLDINWDSSAKILTCKIHVIPEFSFRSLIFHLFSIPFWFIGWLRVIPFVQNYSIAPRIGDGVNESLQLTWDGCFFSFESSPWVCCPPSSLSDSWGKSQRPLAALMTLPFSIPSVTVLA